MNQCVEYCPVGMLSISGTCVIDCSNSGVTNLVQDNICVESCSADYVLKEEKLCKKCKGYASKPSKKLERCINCYRNYTLDPDLCKDAIEVLFNKNYKVELSGNLLSFYLTIEAEISKEKKSVLEKFDWKKILEIKFGQKDKFEDIKIWDFQFLESGNKIGMIKIEFKNSEKITKGKISARPKISFIKEKPDLILFKNITAEILFEQKDQDQTLLAQKLAQAETGIEIAGILGALLTIFSSFVLPSIVGYLIGIFQSVDLFSFLYLINIKLGTYSKTISNFLSGLNFFIEIDHRIWFSKKKNLKAGVFLRNGDRISEIISLGFLLAEKPLKPIVYLVRLISNYKGMLVYSFDNFYD